MVSWASLLIGWFTTVGVCAATDVLEKRNPESGPLVARAGTPNISGTNNGYYYYFASDGTGSPVYTNGPNGAYNIVAQVNAAHWIGGKGWNPGSDRSITFTADFRMSNQGMLEVYGLTVGPLVEYRIVEKYVGTYSVAAGSRIVGKLFSDGSSYDVVVVSHPMQPSVQVAANYEIWSIRTAQRTSGTVTLANHFRAWKSMNLPFGLHKFQIFAVEGIHSNSNVTVTVSEQPKPPLTSTSTSTSTSRTTTSTSTRSTSSTSTTGQCNPLWGQCGGDGWIGSTCCLTGTCQWQNVDYSQCLP